MSRLIDDEHRFREERAADMRSRDLQREPRDRRRPVRRDLAGRDGLQIALIERAAAAQDEEAVDAAPVDATALSTSERGRAALPWPAEVRAMTAYQLGVPTGVEPSMSVRERAAAREWHSLADALVQLAGPDPQTVEELHAAAIDDWGSCTLGQVAAQLRALRWAGFVRLEGCGYVAAEGD